VAEIAYIALGSNVGDRAKYLAAARAAIAALPATRVLAESDVEETEPLEAIGHWPLAVGESGASQDSYLNQMLAVETALEPEALLAELQAIERANGRVGGERWAPRTLDLDIVRYGDRRIATPTLTVPHPELPNRDFWLRELAQVAAG
jgi:2-amino-4-hydroxy-6-hydroxymethyldihydropteridine diphosphokinase